MIKLPAVLQHVCVRVCANWQADPKICQEI